MSDSDGRPADGAVDDTASSDPAPGVDRWRCRCGAILDMEPGDDKVAKAAAAGWPKGYDLWQCSEECLARAISAGATLPRDYTR